MNSILEYLSIDNFFKYFMIISNFIFIIFLVIYNKYYRKDEDEFIPNVLLVISHPDDESMFFRPTIEDIV